MTPGRARGYDAASKRVRASARATRAHAIPSHRRFPVPKLLVHVTCGPDDPTRAALAFLVARTALDEGHEVSLFLAGDAVQLLRDGVLERPDGPGHGPTARALRRSAGRRGALPSLRHVGEGARAHRGRPGREVGLVRDARRAGAVDVRERSRLDVLTGDGDRRVGRPRLLDRRRNTAPHQTAAATSVALKSAPLKSSGSPTLLASASEEQSP